MDKLHEESRKQFEEWFDKFYKSQPMYSEDEKNELSVHLWLAWRDSRRSIVVELPKSHSVSDGMLEGEMVMVSDVIESLRSIGLSIKG